MRYFVIHGDPVAKGRPRFNRATGRAFTPQKTVNYETLVKMEYLMAHDKLEPFSADTALSVTINAFVSIPKTTSKKKRGQMLNGEIRPTKKPDIDNLIKCLFDGCNGVVWQDDKSVVEVITRKWYSDAPRVEMCVTEVEPALPFEF